MPRFFAHGGLRLVLLSLLEDGPRHGYELIVALEDRFMGVYRPSSGTIYPRLAALEDEGLIASDDIDGKRVYRITDAGRQELAARRVDLEDTVTHATNAAWAFVEDLQADIRAAVNAVQHEVRRQAGDSGEARQAVDEIRRAARDAAKEARRVAEEARRAAAAEAAWVWRPGRDDDDDEDRETARRAAWEERATARDAAWHARESAREARHSAKDATRRAMDDARQQVRDATREAKQAAKDAARQAAREAKEAARQASAQAKRAARDSDWSGDLRRLADDLRGKVDDRAGDLDDLVADVAGWAADAVDMVRKHIPDDAQRDRLRDALAQARKAFTDALTD